MRTRRKMHESIENRLLTWISRVMSELFVTFGVSPSALAVCNEHGCAPGYLECNEHGCPSSPRIIIESPSVQPAPRQLSDEALRLLLLQQLIRERQRNQQSSPQKTTLPQGCYKTQNGSFCFFSVQTNKRNPNLKKVTFKVDGRLWENIYVDCVNRVAGDGKGARRQLPDSALLLKACSDYN
jgi:hypothetical protein